MKLKELQANVHDFQLVYDIAHEKQSERIAWLAAFVSPHKSLRK